MVNNTLVNQDERADPSIKINEKKFWEMVDAINWANVSINLKQTNRDVHKFRMLQKYSVEEWKVMYEKHREKYSALRTFLWTVYPPNEGGLGLGDDSTWDLCAHILGLGKLEYIKAFKEPVKALERANKRDFEECFSYWIPRDEKYTLPNSMDLIYKSDDEQINKAE